MFENSYTLVSKVMNTTDSLPLEKLTSLEKIYLVLIGIFVASLVCCNLIFQKFFYWTLFNGITIEASVGIIVYPITFLITDIISEIYGKERANMAVFCGLIASFFAIMCVYIADWVPATHWSLVDDKTFHSVFKFQSLGFVASLMSATVAQFIDIRIFHFCKKLTKGKHLWFRNNVSTLISQFIDSFIVIFLLELFGVFPFEKALPLTVSALVLKSLIALADTPIVYLFVYLLKKKIRQN